jgi:hypothetical protein
VHPLLRRASLAMALLTGLSACASLWPFGRGDERYGSRQAMPISIVVVNDNFYDVTVYALLDGDRRRLGSVVGNTTEEFDLGYRLGSTLRFEIRLLAGRSFVTEPILVSPGDEIIVQVPPHLHRRE